MALFNSIISAVTNSFKSEDTIDILSSLVLSKLAETDSIDDAIEKKALLFVTYLKYDVKYSRLIESWLYQAYTAWKVVLGNGCSSINIMLNDRVIRNLVLALKATKSFDNAPYTADDAVTATDILSNSTTQGEVDSLTVMTLNESKPANTLQEDIFYKWYIQCRYKLCCNSIDVASTIASITGYPAFTVHHTSVMSKVLTRLPILYEMYRKTDTSYGYTFDRVIQCGLEVPMLAYGCSVGDDEVYRTYKNFFIALIIEMNISNKLICFRDKTTWIGHDGRYDMSNDRLVDSDKIDNKYILATWIKGSRNIKSIPFPSSSNRLERSKVEFILSNILKKLPSDLSGTYVSMGDVSKAEEKALADSRISYPKPPYNMLAASGGCYDWPHNRGVYFDRHKPFIIWVNNEDHLRVDIKDQTGNILNNYTTYCKLMTAIDSQLNKDGYTWSKDDMFGYHTTCPSNSGVGMHVGAYAKFTRLCNKYSETQAHMLSDICKRLGFNCSVKKVQDVNICEISNRYCYGYSESEVVTIMVKGLQTLSALEKHLEANDELSFNVCLKQLPVDFVGPVRLAIAPTDVSSSSSSRSSSSSSSISSSSSSSTGSSSSRGTISRSDRLPSYRRFHSSLVAKYLNDSVFSNIVNKRMSKHCKYSLSDAVRVSTEIPTTSIGIYLGSEDNLEHFRPLLVPLLTDIHRFDLSKMSHHTDISVWKVVGVDHIDSTYIKTCQFKTYRNVKNYQLPATIERVDRRKIEYILTNILSVYVPEIWNSPIKCGKIILVPYQPYGEVKHEYSSELLSEAKLIKLLYGVDILQQPVIGSRFHVSGMMKDWSDGRAYYHDAVSHTLILINVDDNHLTIINKEGHDGSTVNVHRMLNNWFDTVNDIEVLLKTTGNKYMHNSHYGYITSCPTTLGTALSIEVVIELKNLSKLPNIIKEICTSENMSVCNANDFVLGSHCWKVSNMQYLGVTEVALLQQLSDCINALIKSDKDIEYREKQYMKMTRRNKKVLVQDTAAIDRDNKRKQKPVVLEDNDEDDAVTVMQVKLPTFDEDDEAVERLYRVKYPVNLSEFVTNSKRSESLPIGICGKYMHRIGLSSDHPFAGTMGKKKLGVESRYQSRYMWIDPITVTFHWCKTNSKCDMHKTISFCNVRSIKATDNTKAATPEELYFTFELYDGYTKIDIFLSDAVSKEYKNDWMRTLVYFINETRTDGDVLQARVSAPVGKASVEFLDGDFEKPLIDTTDAANAIDSEHKYYTMYNIYDTSTPASTVEMIKCKCGQYPKNVLQKYVTRADLSGDTPFHGIWCGKKQGQEKVFIRRFIWIDPILSSIHWCKTPSHEKDHKCVKFRNIKVIRPTQHVTRSSDDEVYFTITLNSGDKIYIFIDDNIDKAVKVDFMKALVYHLNNKGF